MPSSHSRSSKLFTFPICRHWSLGGPHCRGPVTLYARQRDDFVEIEAIESTVTAFRMRFPAGREFVFDFSYSGYPYSRDDDRVVEVRPSEALRLLLI